MPADHVFVIPAEHPVEDAAALDETYFAAWGSLAEGLRAEAGEMLLIRGAPCGLGYGCTAAGQSDETDSDSCSTESSGNGETENTRGR